LGRACNASERDRIRAAAHLVVDPYDRCAMLAMAKPGTEVEKVSASRSVSSASKLGCCARPAIAQP